MTQTAIREEIELFDRLEPLEREWGTLASSGDSIFNTWEWTSLWWEHFGRGRPLAIGVVRSDGRVAAILPLYFWRTRPGRVLRFLGHGSSDQLGPICTQETQIAAGRSLRAYLERSCRRWDVLLAENLRSDEGWQEVVAGVVLRHEANPVLCNDGSGWEGFLASRTSHFRKQLSKRERVLHARHDVRYRLADDPARLAEDMDTLFALHAARWEKGKSSFDRPREIFHREFAACALRRGWLRLWFLEVEGRPVAALYGFRYGGVESCYQAGRDPGWDRSSVGFVLFAHAIRAALADGVTEYRFLRGDDPYKVRFATEDRPLVTCAVASGVRGRALVAAAGTLRSSARLRKSLRAPLEA